MSSIGEGPVVGSGEERRGSREERRRRSERFGFGGGEARKQGGEEAPLRKIWGRGRRGEEAGRRGGAAPKDAGSSPRQDTRGREQVEGR